jgi:hypothetical protein
MRVSEYIIEHIEIRLNEDMIEHIESIHRMDKNELCETYGEMIQDSTAEDMDETKLELACLIYAILYKEPDEFERNEIFRCFKWLEMRDELKAYSHSKSTQRIIKRLYRQHLC